MSYEYDLFKMKISNSDKCTFCEKELETVEHLFYYCECSKAIWIAAENWITSAQSITILFSLQNVLLGFGEQRNVVLTLITVFIVPW